MSHAAAAYFLQKSNEVLSMIKAFKRKTNSNANTVTTTTSTDAMKSSSPASSSAAVNCMHLGLNAESVSFCDNFDASNCNIYTEIDLCNPTKDLVTETTSSTESLSSDILCFIFNNTNDLLIPCDQNRSENNPINSYVNETVTSSQPITQMEINVANASGCAIEQNLYDIDTRGDQQVQSSEQQQSGSTEGASISENALKSNAFFTNISKSLKNKLKTMIAEGDDLDESDETACATELPKHIVDKISLKNRFKFKLKTGFNFFKEAKVRFHQLYDDFTHAVYRRYYARYTLRH